MTKYYYAIYTREELVPDVMRFDSNAARRDFYCQHEGWKPIKMACVKHKLTR